MKTVAIFCAGQAGDIMEASGVLKYRNELWGNHKLVWYIDDANRDLLKHQDIELRPFPRGFGYPEMVVEENKKLIADGQAPVWEDWKPLVDEDNEMNIDLKKYYPSLFDINYGYFPAPHQIPVTKRHNVEYSNCSKMVFGVPDDYEWHPVLEFSEDDYDIVEAYLNNIGMYKKVLIETFAGSGQSLLDSEMVIQAMSLCNQHWPNCEFIFASHKYLRGNEQFPESVLSQDRVNLAAKFTVRQCALIAGSCDIILSVSSGITVAASCWFNRPVPILQFTGSEICSTKSIALGKFELVTADEKSLEDAKKEYYEKLVSLLKKYK